MQIGITILMTEGIELEGEVDVSRHEQRDGAGKRAEGKVEVAGAGRRTETKGCES